MHVSMVMLGFLALAISMPAVAGIDVIGLEFRRAILPQGGPPGTGSDVFADLAPGSTFSSGFASTPNGARTLNAFGDPGRATDCCFFGTRSFGRYSVFAGTNSGSVFDAFLYTQDAWSIAPSMIGPSTLDTTVDTLVSLGSGFTQASNANWAGQRFTLFDSDRGRLAFDSGWLAADASEVLIPTGALPGGTNYFWALFYENRIDAAGLENGSPTSIRFSTSIGNFGQTNAIPEPASWALMIAGFGLVGAVARRRRLTPA
jgi:hypothetical protein